MAPPQRRKIDDLPPITQRPVEMQVLCLGMSRAATMSMKNAFNILGYESYHADEIGNSGVVLPMVYWKEGIQNKYYGKGKPYGKAEFDKMLKNYSAITDIPCILFADELLAAYPNAKVVLNYRDPDKWLVSMEKTFYVLVGWKSVDYLGPLVPDTFGAVWWMLKAALDIWTKHDMYNRAALRQGFLDHYAHVRSVVPGEKLLEFQPQEGWGPLCAFLGKEVPEEPFPHINDAESLIKFMSFLWWMLVLEAMTRLAQLVVLPVAGVGAVVAGVWWARS